MGLVPYTEDDWAFFFGRSTEAAIVAANLRASRLTILYGPSGVGKTSLLMAGAVHSLREEAGAATVIEHPFAVCVFRSWRDDLTQGVQRAARAALRELAGTDALPSPTPSLAETLHAWTARTGTLLVVLDQFEEYFQYHPHESGEERLTGFAGELTQIVNDASLPVHVLLSIREDAWAKLDRFEGHIPSLFANYVRVDHLDLAAAHEAIEGPIAAWNESLPSGEQPYAIEPALVDEVIKQTAGGRLMLTVGGESSASAAGTEGDTPTAATADDRIEAPFLQLVLDRLWRDTTQARQRSLTLARLEALGGAGNIVENHLRDALGRLALAERDAAADCFRFLVSRSKTKIAHTASDLADWTKRPQTEVTAVLDKLCTGESGRILRAIAPAEEAGTTSYELFHDILAEPILAWRKEYEQQRDQEEQQREREAEAARQRRRLRILSGIAAVLVGITASIAAVSLWALHQRDAARHARDAATSIALVSAADTNRGEHLDVSLPLGLDAYRAKPTVQAERSMISTLVAARRSGTEAILRSRQGPVDGVAISPNGNTLATAGSNGTVVLWDARAPHNRLRTLPGKQGAIHGVAFSGDGKTLATTGSDGTVVLREASPPYTQLGQPLRMNQKGAYGVAFSPDGRLLATAGAAGTSLLWKIGKPAGSPSPVTLPAGQVHVVGVAFSPPPAKMLATAGSDGTVVLWDDRAPYKRLATPPAVKGVSLSAIAFSRDGKTLAAAGSDGTVLLWPASGPYTTPLATLPAHAGQGELTDVAFRDGHTLATAGRGASGGGGPVLLWDIRTPERPTARLDGHQGIVSGVAFDRFGNTLASAGSDGTVRLWHTRSPSNVGQPLRGPQGTFYGVAFGPGGKTLATAGNDGHVRLWNASTGSPRRDKPGWSTSTTGAVYGVAFSPNGKTLATAGADGHVRFWNASTGNPRNFKPDWSTKTGTVYGVALSPDGKTLATAEDNGTVQFWNASTGAPLLDKPPRATTSGAVYGVAFSPDRKMVVSGDQDGNVRFWEARTGARLPGKSPLLATPTASGAPSGKAVYGVAFSPDGQILATAGGDGNVRLWDTTSDTLLATLPTTAGGTYGVAFSPDGHSLAAIAGYGGPVQVWKDILWKGKDDLDYLATQVCGLVVGDLSGQEWQKLAPGLAYIKTCHN